MFQQKQKGFTIIEMMIVVLIVAILSSFAVPSYMLALERMKLAEADMMMGNVFRSQQRYKLRTDTRYARYWGQLDMAPTELHGQVSKKINVYCSKDDPQPEGGNCVGNGFKITLYGATAGESNAGVVSERVNNGNYSYKVARLYNDKDAIFCAAGEEHAENDKRVCADFMGLDEYDPSGEAVIAAIEATAEPKE